MSGTRQDFEDEESAARALRMARTVEELTFAWFTHCEDFEGAARERLREEYAIALRNLGALLG